MYICQICGSFPWIWIYRCIYIGNSQQRKQKNWGKHEVKRSSLRQWPVLFDLKMAQKNYFAICTYKQELMHTPTNKKLWSETKVLNQCCDEKSWINGSGYNKFIYLQTNLLCCGGEKKNSRGRTPQASKKKVDICWCDVIYIH